MEYKVQYKRELRGKIKERNGGKEMKKKTKEKCEESKIRDGALGMGREV